MIVEMSGASTKISNPEVKRDFLSRPTFFIRFLMKGLLNIFLIFIIPITMPIRTRMNRRHLPLTTATGALTAAKTEVTCPPRSYKEKQKKQLNM